jgi:4-hydroxy-3-methylbut-2-enyl diphosphate reductase
MTPTLPALTILLAAPRGFCAGVDRAIQIVEKALEKYGAPVYVRHEIVHNRFVVEQLEAKGAVFVKELDEVPADAYVIFSAHGVPKSVPAEADRRHLHYLDATCPLVSKVHREAERLHKDGHHILLIGHAGHPEVIGTMGQLPVGSITLIETEDEARALILPDDKPPAYITQTTLSLDETADIIKALQTRFPSIHSPKKEDICYATTNRQLAVRQMAAQCDALLVIGAENSSNSRRLVEVAKNYGCAKSWLIPRATALDWSWLDGCQTLGITAGASAPEVLVQEVIDACRLRYTITIQEHHHITEDVVFKLPRELVAA